MRTPRRRKEEEKGCAMERIALIPVHSRRCPPKLHRAMPLSTLLFSIASFFAYCLSPHFGVCSAHVSSAFSQCSISLSYSHLFSIISSIPSIARSSRRAPAPGSFNSRRCFPPPRFLVTSAPPSLLDSLYDLSRLHKHTRVQQTPSIFQRMRTAAYPFSAGKAANGGFALTPS